MNDAVRRIIEANEAVLKEAGFGILPLRGTNEMLVRGADALGTKTRMAFTTEAEACWEAMVEEWYRRE